MKKIFSKSLTRYIVTGVFTSLLDWSLFSLLSVPLKINVVTANIISTIVTITISYQINKHFVFHAAEKRGWKYFLSFSGSTLFTGLILQTIVILGIIKLAICFLPELNTSIFLKPAAKIIAMGIGAAINYLVYSKIFRENNSSSK